MNDRIPLEIIVFYPRGYKAITMTLRQKTVVMVLWKRIWRLPITSLERERKSTPVFQAHCVCFPPAVWLDMHYSDICVGVFYSWST